MQGNMTQRRSYLEILDFFGHYHGDREKLVKATDKRGSYGLEDEFMAQWVHPLLKILHVLIQQQFTAITELWLKS